MLKVIKKLKNKKTKLPDQAQLTKPAHWTTWLFVICKPWKFTVNLSPSSTEKKNPKKKEGKIQRRRLGNECKKFSKFYCKRFLDSHSFTHAEGRSLPLIYYLTLIERSLSLCRWIAAVDAQSLIFTVVSRTVRYSKKKKKNTKLSAFT